MNRKGKSSDSNPANLDPITKDRDRTQWERQQALLRDLDHQLANVRLNFLSSRSKQVVLQSDCFGFF